MSKKDKKQKEKAAKVIQSFKLALASDIEPVQFISTGVRAIDRILGGGWARGRVVELYGPYSSGKTLLCQSTIVQVQQVRGWPVYVDREHALDVKYAERTGIDLKRLYYERKLRTAESIFDYIMWSFAKLRKEHPRDLIAGFIDSIAQANTEKELSRKVGADSEGDMPLWDKDMGHRAKIISEAMRKITGVMDDNMLLVIVNQTRSKVGVVYGNPEVTTGGQALPFATSQRLRLQQGVFKDSKNDKVIYDGKLPVGTRVMVVNPKNKVSTPFRRCEAAMSYAYGFLEWPGLCELLIAEGVLAMTETRGELIWDGEVFKRGEFIEFVKAHPEVLDAPPRNVIREQPEAEQ